ncbi:MAG: hypothetical protein ACFFAZ_11165 [Promethearchaeota archaeon]
MEFECPLGNVMAVRTNGSPLTGIQLFQILPAVCHSRIMGSAILSVKNQGFA